MGCVTHHRLCNESFESMKPSIEIQVQGTSKFYPPGITPREILRDNFVSNGCDILAAAFSATIVHLPAPSTEPEGLEIIGDKQTRNRALSGPSGELMRQAYRPSKNLLRGLEKKLVDVPEKLRPLTATGFYLRGLFS
jgi:hypothetical protein